jgi:hypothetical protein
MNMKKALVGSVALVILSVSGCNIFAPPASAVLEGTWTATFDEPGDLEGIDITLTFDGNGQLVSIEAESDDGGTASLDVDNASTTEVDGSDVTITIPIADGTTVFEGTLSEDENTIEGSLSQELELPSGDLDITLPGSGLTLERADS